MPQQRRLLGRSAIVTGSTTGIGFAIAKRLAEEGAKVIISSREKENVKKATKELRDQGLDVKGVVCHVSNPDHRKRLLQEAEENNGLDILVCCAGVNPAVGPLFDCPDSAWEKIFDVNLKAPYLLTKEALYLLKQSKTGRVIYISSACVFRVHHSLGVYALSKTALCALTKNAAPFLAADHITVNCVAPGVINTKFSEVLTPNEKETAHLLSNIFLNRFGEPEDVSGIVAFLASDDAAYITGENIIAAGGIHSRL
ncbi:dehydrogenase/reductase SDR family member 4-like [Anoplophora glabripennis]|uniref:dehydrogenase/reductase SDR family member 4-like n=1 Tax=Anoplophora glabripennis TaxID=217634 RepID=UPI0008753AC3|nr:dehydrogenase/reductase SDR family member 4-like [Anoplophora glabripennis]